MRIGVATCRMEALLQAVASQMIDEGATAMVVLDEDGDTRGWISEQMLAKSFVRNVDDGSGPFLTAADIMEEPVPECPADVPLIAAAQLMADNGVDHLFFLHRAGGRAWPASQLSQRDLVRVLAGSEYIQNQGAAAPRPTPMDLFRQRHGLPKKR
jgi:signal-transduction protein with cAMP-binding, CBS, and nucleotidyltransferase domain